MKKLLLGAFIFGCTTLGFGQSQEEVRSALAKEMVTLVQNTKHEFSNTNSYEDFRSKLLNADQAKTSEGEELMKKIYAFHVDQTSPEKISSNYDGQEIAKAFQKVKALEKSGVDTKEGMTIFSSEPNTENASSESSYPCKWWQLRCHLVQVVGETAADAIIAATIVLLL